MGMCVRIFIYLECDIKSEVNHSNSRLYGQFSRQFSYNASEWTCFRLRADTFDVLLVASCHVEMVVLMSKENTKSKDYV